MGAQRSELTPKFAPRCPCRVCAHPAPRRGAAGLLGLRLQLLGPALPEFGGILASGRHLKAAAQRRG